MALVSKEQFKAIPPAVPEKLKSQLRPAEPVVRQIGMMSMSKVFTPREPEAVTKIYVHSRSPLLGQEVSTIKNEFHLNVELLGPVTNGHFVEGSEFRISGTTQSMETFLKRYF
jgi:hypothetical protein